MDVSADYAIVATPSYVTYRLVKGLPRDMVEALASIPYGPVHLRGLPHRGVRAHALGTSTRLP